MPGRRDSVHAFRFLFAPSGGDLFGALLPCGTYAKSGFLAHADQFRAAPTAFSRMGRTPRLIGMAKDGEVLTALVASLTRAFDDGSPVAGQSFYRRREIAVAALRRIRSFKRRRVLIDDLPHCIQDLAKGLADYLEAAPNLVGPLIKDYQFLASRLLDAYQTVRGS